MISANLLVSVILFLGLVHSAHIAFKPPVWPDEFNATLYKIGVEETAVPFGWTKLYYKANDVDGGYSRFDFYNHYLNLNEQWEPICSIIFYPKEFYVIDSKSLKCKTRPGVGNLKKTWLSKAKFSGIHQFRGMHAEKWILPTPSGDINYYARVGDQTPLRSTNQEDDPGATDYFDFIIGPQKQDLFQLPDGCSEHVEVDCPPDEAIFKYQN